MENKAEEKKTKILLVIIGYAPLLGGAEIGAQEQVKRLEALGYEVVVVSQKKEKEYSTGYVGKTKVHYLPMLPLGTIRPSTARLLKRIINEEKPDLIHAHYILPFGFYTIRIAKKLKIPTLLTLVGWDVYDPHIKLPFYYRWVRNYTINNADRVTAVTSFVRDAANTIRKKRDVAVIPYGVDLHKFLPIDKQKAREELGLGKDKTILLSVQRLDKRKKVDVLLRAFSAVIDKVSGAELYIIGDGAERERLEEMSIKLGLKGRVFFLGRIPNDRLPKYYGAADIFTFHTLHEGLGIVILEAMASSKPVVTTAAGGTTDLVLDARTGYLSQPNDANALAENIVKLCRDRKKMEEFGSKSRKRAEEHFDWDKVVGSYVKMYDSLLKDRKTGE